MVSDNRFGILGLRGLRPLLTCAIAALAATGCGGSGSASSTAADGAGDGSSDAGVIAKWRYVTLERTAQAATCPANSGAEIDTVAVYRVVSAKRAKTEASNWKLVGVAKPDSVVYLPGAASACQATSLASDPSAVAGPVNVNPSGTSGFFRLSDGRLQLQIGACSSGTADILHCDGAGPAIDIVAGDQIAVFEVDQTYLASCDWKTMACGPQTGSVTAACPCAADSYIVRLGVQPGQMTQDLGSHVGSELFINVK